MVKRQQSIVKMLMSAVCVVFTSVLISTTAEDCTIGVASCLQTFSKTTVDNPTNTNAVCQAGNDCLNCIIKTGCQFTADQKQAFVNEINGILKNGNFKCEVKNSVSTMCMNFWLLTLLGVLALVMKP